jgi:hypothetical protein
MYHSRESFHCQSLSLDTSDKHLGVQNIKSYMKILKVKFDANRG